METRGNLVKLKRLKLFGDTLHAMSNNCVSDSGFRISSTLSRREGNLGLFGLYDHLRKLALVA